ncbi:type II toxin-antitoxin system HicB family antitoxin [Candidatus Acetothermia bacterium]|nr:type II toxin-antitoxin system HicB family antitoxin [Candidatus Acetothermia bacterium]MBI3459984.1 type II toxin-antitoxin system HicB family antitoxin [Candidatus Acetothermia bacterium]MBI3659971.1 type II toxin-antitoxin system HicB family antitoxin [Candidatus Acetothermia bacterium]
MKKLTQKDHTKIRELRARFPQEISVRILRSQDGGFCAEIATLPGCLTQADTFSELIDMINDCVRTYFEIPEEYLTYMPTYLPSLKMAQIFNAFPIAAVEKELTLQAPVRETVQS